MEREQQIDVIRRVLAHHRAGTTDRGEREASHRAGDYLDRERFGVEMAATFRVHPIAVAHSSELSRPGEYVTMTVLDTPIVVVRDHDGRVNAFVNVCRHRAATLLSASAGDGLRAIVCPYHSWSYDLSGRLVTIPDGPDSFPACEAAKPALITLPAAERHGFVWVVPDPPAGRDELDLGAFFEGLDAEFDHIGMSDYVHYSTESRSWGFNWKTGVEAFLENYHFSTLHRRSTSKIFLNNLTVVDTFGPHVRAVAPKRSMLALAEQDPETWELHPHATVLYVVFPGLCLFVEKSHVSLLQIVPEGPERSTVRITHAVGQDRLSHRRFWEKNIALFDLAVAEDLDMCESMAAGLRARPDENIVFGRNEVGCIAFREAVDKAVAADRAGPMSEGSGVVPDEGDGGGPR